MERKVKRILLEDLQNFAANKGGKCLSSHFKNNKSKVEWECNFGHTWMAIISNVLHKNKDFIEFN